VPAPVWADAADWREYLQEMLVQFMAHNRGEAASACQVFRLVVFLAIGGQGILWNEDLKEVVDEPHLLSAGEAARAAFCVHACPF
jgi:hypothetical protein